MIPLQYVNTELQVSVFRVADPSRFSKGLGFDVLLYVQVVAQGSRDLSAKRGSTIRRISTKNYALGDPLGMRSAAFLETGGVGSQLSPRCRMNVCCSEYHGPPTSLSGAGSFSWS